LPFPVDFLDVPEDLVIVCWIQAWLRRMTPALLEPWHWLLQQRLMGLIHPLEGLLMGLSSLWWI